MLRMKVVTMGLITIGEDHLEDLREDHHVVEVPLAGRPAQMIGDPRTDLLYRRPFPLLM